jgi:uncharacterized membrane protein YphA (DoxX/SURF4 family)
VVAGVFLYAAIPKIGNPAAFATDVANFRMLPASLVNVAAVTLPWIELVAACFLVLGIWTRGAALVCTGLLLVFTIALGAAVVRGINIECGCFGQADAGDVVGWGTVVRDGVLLVPAILIVLFDRGRYGLGGLSRR